MIRFCLIVLSVMVLPMAAQAEEFSEAQKAAIKELVIESIMENPQTLLDSVQQFQERQEEEVRAEQDQKIQEFVANIPESMKPFSVGNPDGDVHVIEFFDYNCGYCKKAFEEVQKLLNEDKNLYVTFFEMPILGPSSQETAQWAVAASRQGKYFEYHQALMEFKGQKTPDTLEKIAKDVGLDVEKIKSEKDKMDIQEFLEDNRNKAAELGFTGTPGFLINDTPVRGYLDHARMKEAVAAARGKLKTE